jgi:hypothetical protein
MIALRVTFPNELTGWHEVPGMKDQLSRENLRGQAIFLIGVGLRVDHWNFVI